MADIYPCLLCGSAGTAPLNRIRAASLHWFSKRKHRLFPIRNNSPWVVCKPSFFAAGKAKLPPNLPMPFFCGDTLFLFHLSKVQVHCRLVCSLMPAPWPLGQAVRFSIEYKLMPTRIRIAYHHSWSLLLAHIQRLSCSLQTHRLLLCEYDPCRCL